MSIRKSFGSGIFFLMLSLVPNQSQAFVENEKDDKSIDFSGVDYIKSETEPDPRLEKAFSLVYDLDKGEDEVRYFYNKVDLNDDGTPEIFVYLVGPRVCGNGGCSGVIFTEDYKLISQFSLVRNPIIIRDKMTNGWRNIVMYVSGGGMEPTYKELRFDGKRYPLNPSIQPDVKDKQIEGTGIISDKLTKENGIPY